MADRFPSFVFTATFATIFGWLAPAAVGDDPAKSHHQGTKTKDGGCIQAGSKTAHVPCMVCKRRTSTEAAKLNRPSLLEIERRLMPSPLVPGPNRHGELPDYYWAENRALQDRLERAKTEFHHGPTPTYRALTLVAATAGVGKTFIKGRVFDEDVPRTTTCKFDLRELYDAWASDNITTDKADLFSGNLVVSNLKSVSDKSRPRLREYLEVRDAQFYAIDSLDEIHPDDHAWVLKQVEDFVFDPGRQFVHVTVFGRGFAFRDYWSTYKPQQTSNNTRLYLLNPPVFHTTGDLTVSSWNYHSWKYRLAWTPKSSKPSKMPLDIYAEWADNRFSRQGTFRSVTCEANHDIREDVQRKLVDCASQCGVVCGALCNLAGNSMIREILRQDVLENRSFDERRVTEAYLNQWLVRETKVHHRPSIEKPEHLDLYLSLLEHVATKYLEEDRIDTQGYFPVRDSDTVSVEVERRRKTFPVKRILDGSGLVITDPRKENISKYRFEPVWLHRLLTELHDERMVKGHQLALGLNPE